MAPLISASVSSSPPKYFSSSASSDSATVSSSFSRYSAARSARSAGISWTSYLAPMVTSPLASPGQTSARISTRSTTPTKSFSAPIGSCSTSGLAPRRFTMVSTVK
jgi:hypothetical protein